MGAGYSIKAKANEADIFIYEDVGAGWMGGVTAKQFATDLKALGAGVSTLNVHINSSGGDVFDGLAIYRLLVDYRAKVVSHIDGLAASIASVIAMAGQEIRIAEAGFLMIHDAWGLAMGPADDMRRMADLLDTTTGSIADVYVSRTGNKLDEVRAWMKEETWLTGTEAVAKGFADSVVENLRVAAHLDLTKHKFRHAPANLVSVAPPASEAASTPPRPAFEAAKARLGLFRAQAEARRTKNLRTA